MSSINKNVLSIVVSSGENETTACLNSVNSQVNINLEVFHIKGLPNKQAHDTLYRKIESEREHFDLFVKVDGDMVFTSTSVLSDIIRLFSEEENLDHAVFSVLDWYSQKVIMGMHVFSNRCSWPDLNDSLFVDPKPAFPGRSILVWDSPSPVAYHSPNPSIAQAIQFGYHRTLKVVQRKRNEIDIVRSVFHFDLLKQVYLQSTLSPDSRRKAVLYGSERAFEAKEAIFDSRNSTFMNEMIEDFQKIPESEINNMIEDRWGIGFLGIKSWIDIPILKVWIRYFYAAVTRKIFGR